MHEILETTEERAVLVGVRLPDMQEWQLNESLDELASLAGTAGAVVVGKFMQNRQRPDTATFIGKGKVEELADYCQTAEANVVISDRELSPAQARNLEEKIGVKVIDRTQHNKSNLVSLLHQKGNVLKEEYGPEGTKLEVEISKIWADRIREQL